MSDPTDEELEQRMRENFFGTLKGEGIPVITRRSKAPEQYDYYLYSPEYGEPYWIIRRFHAGKLTRYRNCETEALCMKEVEALRNRGFKVQRREP